MELTNRSWERHTYFGCVLPLNPSQLQHTSATIIRKEYGIEAARAILGHNRLTTTEVHAEIDSVKAASVMAKIG